MWTCSAAVVVVLLSVSCSSSESSSQVGSANPGPDARAVVENRSLVIRVTFEVRSAEPGHTVLAARTGSLRATLPHFDARPGMKVVAPLELEGGLAVCLTIDSFYPGSPADIVGVVVNRRWELRGAHSSFDTDTFGLTVDGQPGWGTDVVVDWDREVLARFVVSAAPGEPGAPALAFVPRNAEDTCVETLRPRVIASLTDL